MKRALPALVTLAAGALYTASAPLVHRGDAVGFLLEIRTGLAHDPGHLLARPWAALWVALWPGSAWWALWAVAAVGGALGAGLVCRYLLDHGATRATAALTALTAALAYGAWSTSVTFEDHAWPLALSWLALLLLEHRRVALAGLCWGLALSLHVLAAGAGGALLFAARGGRERLLGAGVAALTVQAAHVSTFLLPWGEQERPSLFYPLAVWQQARQLATTEAIAPPSHPLAWLEGLGAGLLAPVGPPSIGLGVGALLVVTGMLFWRRRALDRTLLPLLAWAVCTLPLAMWVGPSNYEYYRATWTALLALGALLLAPWPRWTAGLAVGALVLLGVLNSRVIGRDWHAPDGVAIGLRDGPRGPEWVQDPGAP